MLTCLSPEFWMALGGTRFPHHYRSSAPGTLSGFLQEPRHHFNLTYVLLCCPKLSCWNPTPNAFQRANTFPLLCYCFSLRFSFAASHHYSIPYSKIPQNEKTVGLVVLSLELSEDAPVCCDQEGTRPLDDRQKPWVGQRGPRSMQPVDRPVAQIQKAEPD